MLVCSRFNSSNVILHYRYDRNQVETLVRKSAEERTRFEEQVHLLETSKEAVAQRANEAELRVHALESELERASAQIQRLTRMRDSLPPASFIG